MFFKIQKSLGRVSAVLTDSLCKEGVCVEFKKFCYEDASIIIYQGGKLEEILSINGWTFPSVFNGLRKQQGDDVWGGRYYHLLSFDVLDPSGSVQVVEDKKLYGSKEALAVEYFYALLYNLSCCKDTAQFLELYEYLIDNEDIFCLHERLTTGSCDHVYRGDKERVSGALHFIEQFKKQLDGIQDTTYLAGLKQRIDTTYKAVLGIIASSAFNRD